MREEEIDLVGLAEEGEDLRPVRLGDVLNQRPTPASQHDARHIVGA